ncbi:MAG: ATP-binding protein [Desulfobacula sp.]|nr:ATP-binding protein [Desulfobacula sp.]MDA8135247.1 ATP-binding protein [Desulfobacteraceae bacterium]
MMTKPLEKDHQFLTRTISSLTDQVDLFETFQDLSLKIISQFDLKAIFSTFSGIVKEVVSYQSIAIYLFHEDGKSFSRAYPLERLAQNHREALPDAGIIHWVMDQGRWTVITDFQDQKATAITSILPIKSPRQAVGFLVMTTDVDPSLYNRKLTSVLNFLASQTAIAIENQGLVARINNSNAYLTNMLESISNGIMAVNMKGEVTLINKNVTAILGIKTKKVINRHYQSFLKGNLKQEMDQLFNSIRDKGFVMESMVHHAPFKGIHIMIGITASLLVDKNRNTIGIIFIFRDMSASKEIERLTRLDEMKSEFVSNVSHELRTPLSIIKAYSEALLTQVKPQDHNTREQFLSVIDSETDRLSTIVSNLLDLSRIEAGKFRLDYSVFSLKDLVNSVISVFKAKPSNIDILTDFHESLPEVEADLEKIREVLINLIANSIKFSPMGGTVNITLEPQDGFVSCSVSDTGIGIPKDKTKHIFKKFYRVDNSDIAEIPGTGLGLSIVKHVLDAHRGRITVDSILGEGSVFTFFLPISRS